MKSVKYVGLDVHRDTVSAAVLDAEGRLVMQSVLATSARAIRESLAIADKIPENVPSVPDFP